MRFGDLYREASRNGLTKPRAIRGSGIRFINMGELFESDWIGDIQTDRVPVSDKEMDTALLEEGDLLFARQSLVREGAGKCSIVTRVTEPTTFDSHLIRVRLNQSKANSYFYQYFFRSPLSPMPGIVSQCAQAGIKGNDLAALDVPCPSLDKQNRIASVLMAYDNLIENNRRQIALLEEAAQRLYREWFVDLRFPGHESASIVNGVPNGWRNCGLNEIVTFHRGFDLPRKSIVDGPYPVVGSTSVIGYHNQFKVCGPGIVTGRSGTLGSHQLIWDDFWPHNTSLYISDYKRHHFLFVYAMISQLDFTLLGGGAAVPTLNRNVLSGFSVLEPSAELQDEFVRTTGPVFNKIRLLNHQVRSAQEARNRLLPKLMSGEIEVEG